MRMLALVAIALAAFLSVPDAARAGRVECDRLSRQIAHFEGMADRAAERENEMWEERTRAHVERLRERREQACPEFAADDESGAEEFAALLKLAGQAALTYFTFGAF